MNKKEIKSKIDEIKAQIKANSKDAHFADTLTNELLSLKGQYEHQPTMVHVAMDEVVDTLEGNTFTIYKTKSGVSGFHLKGGYDIVVQPRVESMNGALKAYIDYQSIVEKLSEEELGSYTADLLASQFVLTLPMYAFTDLDFKFKIADMFADYMKGMQDKFLDGVELQDETPTENIAFEDATTALENIKTDLEKL